MLLAFGALAVLIGSVVGALRAWQSDSGPIAVPSTSEPAIVFPSAPGPASAKSDGTAPSPTAERTTRGSVPGTQPTPSAGSPNTPKTLPGTGPAGPPPGNPPAAPPPPPGKTNLAATNLARGRPVVDTGHADVYVASNAVDGDDHTYWESTNNAFPQSITVDLGSARNLVRVVVKLPPLAVWATRTQTIWILGSMDGSRFTTILGAAGYTFDPATGNAVTIPFPPTRARFARLTFSENTRWPAGQASEIEIYGT